jgi:CDP-diacylglycerol--glycerol-3-phosphate 3-phosphatidyltransferase
MIRGAFAKYVGGLRDFLAKALFIFNPNTLTFLGLVFNIVVGVLFAFGHVVGAGYMMILSGAFDILDGAVARISKKITRFGGYFDSVIDRYSDLAVWVGIMIYFATIGNAFYLVLTSIAMIGAVMISYARARAELVIPLCKVGFMERPERHITLMLGAIFNHLITAIWILAVTTQIDAAHRIFYTWKEIKRIEQEEAEKISGREKQPAGTA